MMPFNKCPVCGRELIKKEVEKLLRGGNNVGVIKVNAEVCLHCGERLYSQETVKLFEEIRIRLERQEVKNYKRLGLSFRVA
ncbi:MAG: YgiT-type zinc finger protein [Candidatus Cloacimonetes bacterium]|nr:YgiT-type zinc finger protein [Candidatus Cloacimonadota bacterium]